MIFANHVCDKELIYKIYKELLQISDKTQTILKLTKEEYVTGTICSPQSQK